jgi:2-oxoisovalerate dehydrogenase E1 component alpha subunit
VVVVKESSGALGLAEGDLIEMYYKVVLSRALSARMWILNRMGRAPFAITGDGHEVAQVASAFTLKPGKDWVVPYYRDMAVCLTVGMTPREIMLGLLAKAADPSSGGRQMPSHYGHAGLRIVSGSSPVATQIPHAVGIALASKLRGEKEVTIVYFGDGATSKGDFHEGLNFAGVHRLPVVFFCENNGYAISVPLKKQAAIAHLSERAAGYGFPGVTVDGNDPVAVYAASKEALERARNGGGPTLIEAIVQRLVPHSSDDDQRRYRSQEELDAGKLADPLPQFKAYLEKEGLLTAEQNEEVNKRVAKEVDDATDFAEKSPLPESQDALTRVYGPEG